MMVNLPCLMESCSNFLRPTCSYTECHLSFLTGSCPTENTPNGYSSCFYLIIYWPSSVSHSTFFSGRFAMFPYVGLVADALLLSDASFSDSFPEPCPTPEYSDPRQGSGILIDTVCFLRIMLHLPVPLPDVGYLSAFSPDHNVCRSAGS